MCRRKRRRTGRRLQTPLQGRSAIFSTSRDRGERGHGRISVLPRCPRSNGSCLWACEGLVTRDDFHSRRRLALGGRGLHRIVHRNPVILRSLEMLAGDTKAADCFSVSCGNKCNHVRPLAKNQSRLVFRQRPSAVPALPCCLCCPDRSWRNRTETRRVSRSGTR